MKKLILFCALCVYLISMRGAAHAQGMMGAGIKTADDHTASEEAEGKQLWEKLRDKQVACANLKDDDFAVLGEYFMGQMLGSSHPAMNAMMTQMMGAKGEELVHVAMGKRLSGCDTSAAIPLQGLGFMPMMNMMWGGWSAAPADDTSFANYGSWRSMMNLGYMPFGWLGWTGLILMVLWWVLIIAGIIGLVRGARNLRNSSMPMKSILDILKERYAKGEIDKKKFERMKKDLGLV